MRSYLKRCGSAFNSITLSGKRSGIPCTADTCNDIKTKQSTCLWYMDEIGMEGDENYNVLNSIENETNKTNFTEKPLYLMSEQQTTNLKKGSASDLIPKIEYVKPTIQLVS